MSIMKKVNTLEPLEEYRIYKTSKDNLHRNETTSYSRPWTEIYAR
jgi:hypothetical protein